MTKKKGKPLARYATIQISPEQRNRFAIVARQQGRSMVWLAGHILESWLEKQEQPAEQTLSQ